MRAVSSLPRWMLTPRRPWEAGLASEDSQRSSFSHVAARSLKSECSSSQPCQLKHSFPPTVSQPLAYILKLCPPCTGLCNNLGKLCGGGRIGFCTVSFVVCAFMLWLLFNYCCLCNSPLSQGMVLMYGLSQLVCGGVDRLLHN